MALDKVLAHIDNDLDGSLARLFDLLAIRSISTDPAFKADCARAAHWLVAHLSGMGFEASVRETAGHPMVVAHAKAKRADAPHVLFYGHYDVQPVDPLNLWHSDPFAPHMVEEGGDKRIVARGAADDKGQLMTFVEACRAFMNNGSLPCHVTILFEGEEECGSSSLPAFLAANREELRADVVLVCDTNMWNRNTPSITTMLRGLVLEEVVIDAASRDLHSGLFGGAAINPIRVLARILSDLHDDNGAVTLPGFYEGVQDLPADVAAQWRALDFSESAFLGDVGLSVPAGEKGRSVLEHVWARPTCDVNGIIGGYTGEGTKTVLPARASAKVSFRLVGAQEPHKILESFHAFVRARLPADCKATFVSHGASAAISLPFDSNYLQKARSALSQEWGVEAVMAGGGGSIPVIGDFKRDLGMDALMIGFGLDDDRIHSPNEKYELKSYHKGTRSWARVLDALAR